MTRGLLTGSLLLEAVEVGGASRDSQAGRFSLQLPSGPGGHQGFSCSGVWDFRDVSLKTVQHLGGFRWSHEKRHRFDPIFVILFPDVKSHFLFFVNMQMMCTHGKLR